MSVKDIALVSGYTKAKGKDCVFHLNTTTTHPIAMPILIVSREQRRKGTDIKLWRTVWVRRLIQKCIKMCVVKSSRASQCLRERHRDVIESISSPSLCLEFWIQETR